MTRAGEKQPPPLPGDVTRRIRLMAQTRTVGEIHRATGVSKQRIRRFLRRNGIEPVAHEHPLEDVDVLAEVAELESLSAVARKYGVSKQAVDWRLRRELGE